MAVGQHFADGVVGLEHGFVAGLAANHRELACPGGIGVVRINVKLGGRGGDIGQLLQPIIAPIVFGAEVEGGADEVVGFRIINFELLAAGDGAVVPVVGAAAVEVGLGDFRPVFRRVGA